MAAELHAVVYVSQGTWVARCPRPWCIHADHYGPGPHTGRIGGLTLTTWHCMRCELVCPADWPTPEQAETIWRLLMARPQFETRNWNPGEPIENLLAENALHGLIQPGSLPGGAVMADGVLTDLGLQLVPAAPTPAPLAIGGR